MDDEHDDRRVARRSDDEVRRIAQRIKAYYRIERTWPVNIGRVLRSGKVLTLRGEKRLIYNLADDRVLGIKDARTEIVDDSVVVTAKSAIDSAATWGDGRSRMTLSHELGHAVMHAEEGRTDHRAAGASGLTTLSRTNASESAEHQAKVFASAFLIDDKRASELESPLEIATEFLVSMAAAEISYERIQSNCERAAAAARVMKANREFQVLMMETPRKRTYLSAHCISCKSQALIPIGIKVVCETCGYVGDHPEDG